ncbi:DUF3102 domain-containing protein [Myxosarcina sp. GI1(2024)]
MRRTVQDIVEIGRKLSEVKAQLGHGNFLKWLKYEFEWQERSARNFMRVAEAFKTANFADLDFAASALYLLAAPSVPEQVRQTALELADRGETITYSKAKDLVDEYKKNRQQFREDLNPALKEDEAVATASQTEHTPTVDVFAQSERELQVAIAYEDVRVSITGSKNSLKTFLEQIQSNPSLTDEILQQIGSQIDESEITPP